MVFGICFQCLMLHEICLHPFSLENVPELDGNFYSKKFQVVLSVSRGKEIVTKDLRLWA